MGYNGYFHPLAKALFERLVAITLLVAGSLPVSTYACSYPNDAALQTAQTACSQKSTQSWDCSLNRCVNTKNSIDERHDYEACANLPNAAAQKICAEKLAQAQTGLEMGQESDDGKLHLAMGVDGAFATVSAINLLSAKYGNNQPDEPGKCFSKTIFLGTSVASLGMEVYAKYTAKKKLEKLQDDYKEEATKTNPYEAQIRAFEYLKEEQETIKKIARFRHYSHMISTLGYTSAAAIAGYESLKASCQTGVKFLGSSYATLAMSVVGTGAHAVLMQAAKKEEEKAEENIEHVEKILAQFKETVASYCPNGRDDLNDPYCYCYTSAGAENNDRSNSQTCQNLWASGNKNLHVEADEYGALAKAVNDIGCMTIDRKFDANCDCRQLKNSAGENACYKVAFSGELSPMGVAIGAPSTAADLSGITQGKISPANLASGSTLGKRLARARKLRDNIYKEMKKSNPKITLPKYGDNLVALTLGKKTLSPKSLKEAGRSSLASLSKSSRPQSGPLARALKKAEKTAAISSGNLFGASSKRLTSAKKKKTNWNFSMGDNSQRSSNKIENIVGQSDREYDYAGNDIVSRSDVSIWKVISNRYYTSGLKRLFSE